jgi:Mg-chelatase subunit ChlD
MTDPFMDPTDGTSYEKSNLVEWIRKKHHSPMTRLPLEENQIVPNRNLKELIEQFRQANPHVVDAYNNSMLASSTDIEDRDLIGVPALDRKPLVLFAVIDNSGSMQLPCGDDANEKNNEGDSFSRLDMVKHTLNTIITSLTPRDMICIIKFHTTASIFIPLQNTTENNKKVMMERLTYLEPENQTNIWDGLRVAFDEICKLSKEDQSKNVQIYLLTDGEPTIHPPKPMVETMTTYMDRKLPKEVKPVINTFGYGYKLDSKMLYSIAEIGNGGAFGFIPDASMVGTVFINALSNSLILQDAFHTREHLTPLMINISREFVQIITNVLLVDTLEDTAKLSDLATFVGKLRDILTREFDNVSMTPRLDNAKKFIQDLILDCSPTTDASLGQIAKSVEKRFFDKWGSHYLRSVLTAFERMTCTNFKDKAMQSFCSARFIDEQSRIEEVFLGIQPPKPSISNRPLSYYYGSGQSNTFHGAAPPAAAAAASASVNMARYYDASGGCFTGESMTFVVGEDGMKSKMEFAMLKKGMKVMTPNGVSEIETVVRLKYSGAMYELGQTMSLTPFHPVSINGKSFFPKDLFANIQVQKAFGIEMSVKEVSDIYVYDVILANRGIMSAPLSSDTSLFVATWGHNIQDDEVFAHDYFASEKIVDDLKQHKDYAMGSMTLDKPTFIRDQDSLRVVKLTF